MPAIYNILLTHVNRIAALIGSSFRNEYSVNQFLRDFGWTSSISSANATTLSSALNIVPLIEEIRAEVEELSRTQQFDESTVEHLVNVIIDIYDKFDALNNVSFYPFNQPALQQQLKSDYINYILSAYIRIAFPKFYGILRLINVVETEYISNAAQPNRIGYTRYTIKLNNLFNFIINPIGFLKTAYNWSDSQVDPATILLKLKEVLNYMGAKPGLRYPSATLADHFYTSGYLAGNEVKTLYVSLVDFKRDRSVGGAVELGLGITPIPSVPLSGNTPRGFAIVPSITGSLAGSFPLSPSSSLNVKGNLSADDVIWFLLYPNSSQLQINLANIGIDGEISWEFQRESPLLLLGGPEETRIEIPAFFFSAEVKGLISDPEFELGLGTSRDGQKPVKIVINPGAGDSFITKVLGTKPVEITVGGTIFWSSKSGIRINGNVGFTLEIPINKTLGPLLIESLTINPVLNNSNFSVNLGLSFGLTIGPLDLRVDNIGAKMILKNLENSGSKGIFNNIDVDWAFKAPTGIGLSIDASAVKGGGFLNYDEATYTYTGGLELSFSKISFSAIGIVSTRLPGGKPGYSLLIIISAEFTPIQLGMGFTLNGIGGILGLNRTMNPDVLRTGIRDNTLDSILFPRDIVKNANTIISNIGQAFPAKEGQFLIGPMAKIGWGTPTLLTIELGIIIELPEPVRLAILGVVKALLPSKDNAIVKIQVNFLGIIDFTNKYLSFDASLYDSQILTFGLFGDMALRLYWGDKPNFLLSVGGFHPKFTPPPLNLPELRRLTLVLANQNNLKISVETYFAVTSNSVQFGARVAAMAKAWKIEAVGALWFDILFQFSPFYFIADMGVMFAIKMGSKTILSLYVDLTLEGPNPWRARGKGSFKVLFVKVSVSFDKTFGQARVEAIQAEAIDAKVKAALVNRDNWEALLPDRSHQLISWREEDLSNPNTEISVDPAGALKISQRLLPLQTTMAKFGSSAISDFKRYDITSVMAGSDTLPKQVIQDNFARNEFFYMTDDEKLSRPSYELFDSGVVVGSDRVDAQYAVHMKCHYEEITLDAGYRRPEPVYYLSASLFGLHHFGNYISRSGLSDFDRITTSVGPNKVKVDLQHEEFVLIDRNNMSEVSGYFSNSAEAQQFLSAQQVGAPATAANWIIANRFEL